MRQVFEKKSPYEVHEDNFSKNTQLFNAITLDYSLFCDIIRQHGFPVSVLPFSHSDKYSSKSFAGRLVPQERFHSVRH